MVTNKCFLYSVSEFKNLKRQAARFYFNHLNENYEVKNVFGETPTRDEIQALSHNNSINEGGHYFVYSVRNMR